MCKVGFAHLVLGGVLAIGAATTLSSPVSAADMPVKAPPSPQFPVSAAPSSVWWTGADFKKDTDTGYIGGIYALNGNLSATGWLVRGQFTYVGYNFDSTLAPSGQVDANYYRGQAALGYQIAGVGYVASAFVGVDYQSYKFSPAYAVTNPPDENLGAIFFARIATPGGSPYPIALEGQYSTANDDYWVRFRPGIRLSNFTIGPEIVALGNDDYNEFRYGGFVSYDFSNNFILQVNAGYADVTRNSGSAGQGGSDSAYGGLTLVFLQ